MLKLHNIQFIVPEVQVYFHDIFISFNIYSNVEKLKKMIQSCLMEQWSRVAVRYDLSLVCKITICMGMRFVPSADVYFKNYLFYFYYFVIHVIIHASFFPPPSVGRFYYRTKLTKNRANLAVFRGTMTRPPLENVLCVDLCYLILRTYLALNKAMMVCMDKDLLAYTAATAVGVINRKVIYMLAILFECCF